MKRRSAPTACIWKLCSARAFILDAMGPAWRISTRSVSEASGGKTFHWRETETHMTPVNVENNFCQGLLLQTHIVSDVSVVVVVGVSYIHLLAVLKAGDKKLENPTLAAVALGWGPSKEGGAAPPSL